MSQQEAFFGYYFKPTITLKETDFFGIWCFTFSGQLRRLHEELVVEDENGVMTNFHGMDYTDFCILTYRERPDLIDYLQN